MEDKNEIRPEKQPSCLKQGLVGIHLPYPDSPLRPLLRHVLCQPATLLQEQEGKNDGVLDLLCTRCQYQLCLRRWSFGRFRVRSHKGGYWFFGSIFCEELSQFINTMVNHPRGLSMDSPGIAVPVRFYPICISCRRRP